MREIRIIHSEAKYNCLRIILLVIHMTYAIMVIFTYQPWFISEVVTLIKLKNVLKYEM